MPATNTASPLPGYPTRCAGVDDATPCLTPRFDVQLCGRCTRCDQLRRRTQLATVDPWETLNRALFTQEEVEAELADRTPLRALHYLTEAERVAHRVQKAAQRRKRRTA